MTTAGLKWKDFKAELKQKYFDETLTDEELMKRNQVLFEENGERVNDNDWNYLIGFWRSDESKARTARAKACRAKVQLLHTSGSVSHACARHDLGEDLGRPARRDEVFIKTHTRKNGVPSSRQAASTIGELKSAVKARPELKDRTIQQGDAYAVVCGVKEPRGRVRVLGLGPSPQEIGTPGLKSYVPTRIQMEVLAREKVESENAALEQRVKELEEQILEERIERNAEIISQHGSNSRHQVGAEIGNYEDNEDYDLSGDEDENLLDQRHVAAPSVPIMDITSPRYAHDTLVGKDVVLYAMLRSDQPVAKGTIVSTNPNTRVGGQPLGKQFCEVIVNVVMKRDAILPRPYDHMESMAGAYMMSIAWPYKKLKVCNGASKSSKGVAGSARRG